MKRRVGHAVTKSERYWFQLRQQIDRECRNLPRRLSARAEFLQDNPQPRGAEFARFVMPPPCVLRRKFASVRWPWQPQGKDSNER